MSRCIRCTADLVDGSVFCHRCGTNQELRCPHCSTKLPPTAGYCITCGKRIASGTPMSPAGLADDLDRRSRLKKKEVEAKDFDAWVELARSWKRLGDSEEAERCLQQAQQLSESAVDWRTLAESWVELFNDRGRARQCLAGAQHVAFDDVVMLTLVAKWWKDVIGDEQAAWMCLKRAEFVARYRTLGTPKVFLDMVFDRRQEIFGKRQC